MISSIRPHCPSTTTTSSSRIASVNASWIPAKRLASRRLRREAGDHRDQPGRGEHSGTDRAGLLEGQQRAGHRGHHQHQHGDPPREADLGAHPARVAVVATLRTGSGPSPRPRPRTPGHRPATHRTGSSRSGARAAPRSSTPAAGLPGVAISSASHRSTTTSTTRSGRRARRARLSASQVRRPSTRVIDASTSASTSATIRAMATARITSTPLVTGSGAAAAMGSIAPG